MIKLRLVRQKKGSTECGVACVAMLARITPEQAHACIHFPNSKNSRTTATELRKALKQYGIVLQKKVESSDWKSLKQKDGVALVATRYNKDKDEWHWILFNSAGDGERFEILDPERGHTDQIRTRKMSWYHTVKLPSC